jgi:hemolysin activation/secretion protein
MIARTADDDDQVPFYFQPTIGGSTTVRGFADYRFRDEKAMYMNVEYRWEAFSGLDMALFSDWGKVATADEDLDFNDLKHGYGIGFRFNTYKNVFFRFDIGGGGGEGVHYFVKYSRVF